MSRPRLYYSCMYLHIEDRPGYYQRTTPCVDDGYEIKGCDAKADNVLIGTKTKIHKTLNTKLLWALVVVTGLLRFGCAGDVRRMIQRVMMMVL